MKKILLSISVLTSFFAGAQTLTQFNHTPSWWDRIYSMYQCDSTTILPGASGGNATWSYTPVVHTSILSTFTTAISANASFNPADAVISSSSSNASYYKTNSATSLPYYGGNISINGFVGVVKYSSPAIVASYPMSLNTSTISAISGTITLTQPFPITANFNGSCSVIADASGTLALPTRTFTNILRLATTQNLIATGSATINLITYDYYEVGASKAPIISIQTSTLTSSFGAPSAQTVTTLQKDYDVVGIKESKTDKSIVAIYPNPASVSLTINAAGVDANIVVIYDVTGKAVLTEQFEGDKKNLNVSSLNEGIYFYNIIGKDKQVNATGKFNVNR